MISDQAKSEPSMSYCHAGDPGHEGQLVAAAPCAACGQAASLPHMNCANIDCNKLFLACQQHQVRFASFMIIRLQLAEWQLALYYIVDLHNHIWIHNSKAWAL